MEPDNNIIITRSSDGAFTVPDWVSDITEFQIETPEVAGVITIYLSSGDRALYKYFPFSTWIYCDGTPAYIVDFEKEHENCVVRFEVDKRGIHTLRFEAELSSRPSDVGPSNDVRRISAHVTQIKFTPSESRKKTPRPIIRDKKFFGLSDHSNIHPIFIIGSYRSGTSISTWIVGQHPNIVQIEENTFLIHTLYSSQASYELNASANVSYTSVYDMRLSDYMAAQGEAFSNMVLRNGRQSIIKDLALRLNGTQAHDHENLHLIRSPYNPKQRWVTGTPEYSEIALGLPELFPNAKFIFLLRNPLDVVKSLMRFDTVGAQAYSFSAACAAWESLTYRSYEAYLELGPDKVFFADYRRLRRDTENLIDAWWDFLGEPRFNKAINVTQEKINSSQNTHEVEIDMLSIQRLSAIYEGILEERPLNDLPWRSHLKPFSIVRNDIVHQMKRLISS